MISNKKLNERLKREIARLKKLDAEQTRKERERRAIIDEKKRLMAELKLLKAKTGKGFSKLVYKASSPETKAKVKVAKKKVRSAWAKFQKFANKYGD